jgi:hypothetical protein
MIWQRIRFALLASSVMAAAALPVRADDEPAKEKMAAPPPPAAASADCCAPCAPPMRTICVTEWVPEKYETTRTVYKTVCEQEKYKAIRVECVPVEKTRTVNVCRVIPEVKEETRQVCVMVPTVEERTVMKPVWTCHPETCMVRKCVDRGHYECREVPCGPTFKERMHKLCHRNDCCEDTCCPPPTKTVQVWVPCKVWEETPVTKMVRVCNYVPEKVSVTVCKPVMQERKFQVTVCKTVTEEKIEKFTVLERREVPYEATRTVAKCVPVEEKVTCVRMVARTVEKQVPVAICCEETSGHGGRFHKANRCCK